MTTSANIYVDQGVDYSIELNVFDNTPTNDEYTINNQSFSAKAKKMYSSGSPFTISVSVDTSDGDPNNLILTIPAETSSTLKPGKYRYDVLMTTDSNTLKILEGLLIVLPTISL